jgi:hypothetical protein
MRALKRKAEGAAGPKKFIVIKIASAAEAASQ